MSISVLLNEVDKMASFEPVLVELFAPNQFDWYNACMSKKYIKLI